MARYRVTCTTKDENNERIIGLGCYAPGNVYLKFTEAEVIARIEGYSDSFYVERPDGHVADLMVAEREGRKYLKTVADGERPDNLLSQPHCPQQGNGSKPARTVVPAASHGDPGRIVIGTTTTPPAPPPPFAAAARHDYQQFVRVDVPEGSGAIEAYRGFIRPFSDDENARHVLRALEADAPLIVSSGRLDVDVSGLPRTSWEDFLVDMAVPCTVLVLGFAGPEHHRAFLVDPELRPRLSRNHHVRMDRSLLIDGRLYPALCVYSGSLFHYSTGSDRLEQFLDQTATYLAKHLIWLRTRMLFRSVQGHHVPEVARRRRPGDGVAEVALLLSTDLYWDGYWPGQTAPAGPSQHLATVRRDDECWCWSGRRYGDCHRERDLKLWRDPKGPARMQ
jgi:Protein of unknown function (DUF3892)